MAGHTLEGYRDFDAAKAIAANRLAWFKFHSPTAKHVPLSSHITVHFSI
jgi:hypothetical protein